MFLKKIAENIPGLDTEKKNFLDILFKVIAAISFLVVSIAGLFQYKMTEQRNFQKEFYKQQIEVLEDIVAITSELAYLSEIIDIDVEARDRYENLSNKFLVYYRGRYKLYTNDHEIKGILRSVFITLERDPVNYDGDISQELSDSANRIAVRSNYIINQIIEL